jgi:diguanylate cyclase (GGDEF)-like protein
MPSVLPPAVRWTLVAAAWLVGCEVSALVPSHPGSGSVFGDWVSEGVMGVALLLCALRGFRVAGGERRAWLLISVGIAVWVFGDVYWLTALAGVDQPPIPSPADIGYLLFGVLAFAGLVSLVHARVKGVPRGLVLDGAAAALAAAAVSAAIVVGPVASSAEGGTWAVATNLAYPLIDVILIGIIVGAVALRGWRLDRTWALLLAGTVAFWLADSFYLVAQAAGTYVAPAPLDIGWAASTVLYAAAAWMPPGERTVTVRRGGLLEICMPLAFAIVAVGVLVGGSFDDVSPIAIVLATLSLAAVIGRLAMAFRENALVLQSSRTEALTDSLTALGNRRALTAALERALPQATDERPLVLVLFDLDGFKHYNDSFGHPAGDALLSRLGHALGQALTGRGEAFRMGGDEFCALIDPGDEVAQHAVEAAAQALSAKGEGFSVGCSYGVVTLPIETGDADTAVRLADQRMYAAKNGGRASAGRQSKDVLLRALAERDPGLGEHTTDVATLAELVARRLGLAVEEVEQVRHAAELHDIGKVAIPDAILHKPGPLDDDEWAFVRRHTLIGERIIAAAPSLGSVATLVRASHERFDGAGYPDGMIGKEIPLGARIVAVCDAFDAMVTDRSYRSAMPAEAALDELRRCAGAQFDPIVVEAFCAAWATTAGREPLSLPR